MDIEAWEHLKDMYDIIVMQTKFIHNIIASASPTSTNIRTLANLLLDLIQHSPPLEPN